MPNKPHLWLEEYNSKGIPSSFKEDPSSTMNLLFDYFDQNKIEPKNLIAADLGCGKGRNTLTLIKKDVQKVYAIDFVQSLIDEVRLKAKAYSVSEKIIATCHDLTKLWPIENNSLDLIIDIFCFKHQTTQKDNEFYKKELNRVLKQQGLLLLSLAGADDGYYGSLQKVRLKTGVYKVTDPKTKVESLLFTKESLLSQFPNFSLEEFLNDHKRGPMHEQFFRRSTLKFILKKK